MGKGHPKSGVGAGFLFPWAQAAQNLWAGAGFCGQRQPKIRGRGRVFSVSRGGTKFVDRGNTKLGVGGKVFVGAGGSTLKIRNLRPS